MFLSVFVLVFALVFGRCFGWNNSSLLRMSRHAKFNPASAPLNPMQGLHLTADLFDCACDSAWLTNAEQLGAHCLSAVSAAGLQPVNQVFHTFPATAQGLGGVTASILIAESHLCVHTWPEQAAVTLDVYVCNFGGDHSAQAQALMAALLLLFQAGRVSRRALQRGVISAS